MLELPCYVGGERRFTEKTKKLFSFEGVELGIIHGTTPKTTRDARRLIAKYSHELSNLKTEEIFHVIEKTMEYYLKDLKDLELISKLSGTPISFVSQATEEFRRWALECKEYVRMAFGYEDYENIPISKDGKDVAKRIFLPRGPTVAILPQNDAGESIYIITNAILAKCPVIIKPSSEAAAALPPLKYIEALEKAIKDLGEETYGGILKCIAILNIIEDKSTEKMSQVLDLFADGDQLIVFGSEESIDLLVGAIEQEAKLSKVIRFGTGFSISVVLSDARLEHAAHEVATSAAEDKGNQCHSTDVVYVDETVYDTFLEFLEKTTEYLRVNDPLDPKTIVGKLHPIMQKQAIQRFSDLYGTRFKPRMNQEILDFSLLELELEDHVEEIPAPILIIKKIRNLDEFLVQGKKDVERNNLKKNLITSVYTTSLDSVISIARHFPSHTVKLSKGSGKMDFFLEHQGIYLIQELLDKKILELI